MLKYLLWCNPLGEDLSEIAGVSEPLTGGKGRLNGESLHEMGVETDFRLHILAFGPDMGLNVKGLAANRFEPQFVP